MNSPTFLQENSDDRIFHKLDEIFNNMNIDINGFTTWKQNIPVKILTRCEYWIQAPNEPLIPSPTLSFLY